MTSLETYTGLYFDYSAPRPEDVCLEDIARALSMTCRFGGHVTRYFSVAEHAMNVANHVFNVTGDPELALQALHHDSHEAYIGDLPTPLKRDIGDTYKELKETADSAIVEALDLPSYHFDDEVLREADALALAYEASFVKKSRGLGEHWGRTEEIERPDGMLALFLDPITAEYTFLETHKRFDDGRRNTEAADAA
jgi:hypothetical protein